MVALADDPASDGSDSPLTSAASERSRIREALASIVVLNSPSNPKVKGLLDAYDGRLTDVGPNLLRGLRNAPPPSLAARVGDFNENLSYEMRGADQDVGSIVRGDAEGDGSLEPSVKREVDSFEATLRASLQRDDLRYRGSFLRAERTMYQPAHVDYDHPVLERYGKRLFLAFFPLTREGAHLQLWREP
ncbi:hypothetical protein ACHAWF_007331 [Thalassiosira exigua]